VLVAIPCLKNGGTEIQTLSLVRALQSSEYIVNVICYFEHDPHMVEEYRKVANNVILMNLDRNIKAIPFIAAIREEIRKDEYDIVHVQYMTPGALPILACKLCHVKTILATVHQPYSVKWHKKTWWIILRVSSLLTNHFISISQSVEKSWFGSINIYERTGDYRRKRHFTVYNSIDIDKIDKILSIEQGKDKVKKYTLTYGYIGRISEEKGADILVKSFSELYNLDYDVHLVIVGDGPDMEKIRRSAEENFCSEGITFLGMKTWEEAMSTLMDIDVLIVPSRFEGFGLSAAEAMAASIPVIVSNVFGLKEIVTDGYDGIVFENENSEDLSRAMKFFYHNKEKIRRFGENARLTSHKYDIKKYTNNIQRIYQELR
jgi:glycosyltransferase involved in cell wall biosynthesis